jgi:heat shock protein HslJ
VLAARRRTAGEMTVRVWSALVLAGVAGLLPSCTFPDGSIDDSGGGTAAEPPARPSTTPEGSWSLESGTTPGGPIVVPTKHEITLEIAPLNAVGRSTCNSYGGRVRVTAQRVRFGQVTTTLIGCEKALSQPEGRYYDALPRVRAWRIDASTLRLTGPGVELLFRPA